MMDEKKAPDDGTVGPAPTIDSPPSGLPATRPPTTFEAVDFDLAAPADDPGPTIDTPPAQPATRPQTTFEAFAAGWAVEHHADVDLSDFELTEEIGRGGMGSVYRARDRALNREVAFKVLLERYAPDSRAADRFISEAQITGQLQHPGIPAVYQVGHMADGRPFLAMKLIKGRTLDSLLKGGHPLNATAVFEAIAQAVGYAHAHGVIHRDLKPGNIMVGSFGEVQVMDWGLAKILGDQPPPRDDSGSPEASAIRTEIRSLKDTDGTFTLAGSVLGTPAYMPPEQAAGEIDRVDRRSDVFGLGAILCALLTGSPPFSGQNAESVRLAAVRGKTEEAFARLDQCGAEPEVVALCKRCLSFEPDDRPADATAVAEEIARLRAAADERARQAELARTRAEVQAEEQRRRRRMLVAAFASVAAVLLLGIVGTTLGLIRANRARNDATSARNVAESNEKLAQAENRAPRRAWPTPAPCSSSSRPGSSPPPGPRVKKAGWGARSR